MKTTLDITNEMKTLIPTVKLDQGSYLHLRFSSDQFYWFDVIAAGSTLMFNGDIGTFVFRPSVGTGLEAFQLFDRRRETYWAEKLQAASTPSRTYDFHHALTVLQHHAGKALDSYTDLERKNILNQISVLESREPSRRSDFYSYVQHIHVKGNPVFSDDLLEETDFLTWDSKYLGALEGLVQAHHWYFATNPSDQRV